MTDRLLKVIQSLQIRNFKCFENQNFDFGRLTLFSGINGTGKSSVLQSLVLLRQSHQQGLLQTTGLALNGDLIKLGTGQDVFYEQASSSEFGFSLVFEDEATGYWFFDYDQAADVVKLAKKKDPSSIYNRSIFNDSFQYLYAERVGPRSFYPTSDFFVREHKQLGVRGEYTAHFLDLFRGKEIPSEVLAHPNEKSLTLKPQVEAWMGEISPGVRITLTPYPEIDQVVLQYSFAVKGEVSNHYRPTNTGFGITYTLPVVVALLSASPEDLILIENPESHLHPQGQVKIGELMARAASCGIQIVVETHSDHVLNGLRIAVRQGLLKPNQLRIHFLERDGFSINVVSPQVNENGRIDQWPEGFFDEWEKSLEKLL